MIRSSAIRLLALAALLPLLGACRTAEVESEPGPAYTLEVHNPMPHPMIVSYNDGTGVRLLGTVAANARQRFVITRPAGLQITVTATDEDRTHTVTKTVTLRPGAVAAVTLSP